MTAIIHSIATVYSVGMPHSNVCVAWKGRSLLTLVTWLLYCREVAALYWTSAWNSFIDILALWCLVGLIIKKD